MKIVKIIKEEKGKTLYFQKDDKGNILNDNNYISLSINHVKEKDTNSHIERKGYKFEFQPCSLFENMIISSNKDNISCMLTFEEEENAKALAEAFRVVHIAMLKSMCKATNCELSQNEIRDMYEQLKTYSR